MHIKTILILIVVGTVTFSTSNFLLNGSLKNTQNLSGELKSPSDSLYLWKIAKEPPFKYRLLHKTLSFMVYRSFVGSQDDNNTFFSIYRCISLILHIAAIIAFYFFLAQCGLRELAFVGALFFSFLPPLLLAYNVPVHTREDTLAYLVLLMGLIYIIRNNILLILVFSIAGVLCRETLLLLPFVNLFFNKKQSIYLRLFISFVTIIVFLSIRLSFGIEHYNHWEGLRWNLTNLEQVLGFGYVSFGFLWIPFLYSFFEKNKLRAASPLIYNSRIPVFLLILLTTFFGGIFNEIRILYLLAPWVIAISLYQYDQNKAEILMTFRSRKFQLYGITLFILIASATTYGVLNIRHFTSSKYDIPFETWIVVTAVQLYLGVLILPYFYKKLTSK